MRKKSTIRSIWRYSASENPNSNRIRNTSVCMMEIYYGILLSRKTHYLRLHRLDAQFKPLYAPSGGAVVDRLTGAQLASATLVKLVRVGQKVNIKFVSN